MISLELPVPMATPSPQAVRNVNSKKKHPGYEAYEDEYDEFGDVSTM